ncbi:aldo/keto reductase [Alkalicoccobacillus porphyridii]|uniref:Aldo/keto reductase n=1 Tax=Alkalicoccobacillus porphyridii TaxID=2597270 RepID=A0A553ZUW9_9BACI|nr:aldo/keto reductase [Alkalicoccobacillus porphyridii]TSB45281.1 aldo/keto reductase [Alkalicoccobacillus porphyridii]
MEYRKLGRTDMDVSVMSLGSGGHSRLGTTSKKAEEDAIVVLQKAIEKGINLIDTANVYGTEELVGKGVSAFNRQDLLYSTKCSILEKNQLKTVANLESELTQSLTNLRTDYIDIYHLHAVNLKDYDHAVNVLLPQLVKYKEQGIIRAIGITEQFNSEPNHSMLELAVEDNYWDVIMVGFNILNQSARQPVLKKAIKHDIGVLGMFAVRRALAKQDVLSSLISQLITEGRVDPERIELEKPLDFLVNEYGAESVIDASYRFCRDEPGIHTVLMGTGDVAHLESNIQSAEREALPSKARERLQEIFEKVDHITGN